MFRDQVRFSRTGLALGKKRKKMPNLVFILNPQ